MQTKSIEATVWSQYHCVYCDRAKTLLTAKGIKFNERIIGQDEGNWTKEALMRAVPDARSIPQIFINDQHIGGYADLVKYLNDNP
jgi:glutaredoxin 3